MNDQPKREYDPSSTIAMFIAAALQHPNPPCNGCSRWTSTIFVSQHKNKFDQVVVYCILGAPDLVSEVWAQGGHDGDPSDDFAGKCMLRDAEIYRDAYRKILFLAPQYREMTLARPNYGYLLHDDVKDAEAWLDETIAAAGADAPDAHESQGHARACPKFYLNRVLRQWRVPSTTELRKKLRKVYKHDW